jgi:hypothetical protein
MAYTELDIWNFALARIGVSKTVASPSEQSKERSLCSRFYPLCRDEVLERVPWPFAVKVEALAPLANSPLLPDWGYAYAEPTDMASLLEVVPSGDIASTTGYYTTDCCGPWQPARGSRYSFRRALNQAGTLPVILTNLEEAYAVYVRRVTNTAAFSAMMVSAIADRLAMELAMPMTVDPRWYQVAQQRYALAFMDTASRQFEQEKPFAEREAPSIRARG